MVLNMDLLTHTLSGIAAATVIAPFAGKKIVKSFKILGFSALGEGFPDIDAIIYLPKYGTNTK